VARALARGEGGRSDDQLVARADGTTFPAELAVQPIAADGGPLGAVVVFHDITERRELEVMKDDFIAVASHELRTPLTSVVGYLQLALSRREDVGGAARDLLEVAERNGRRLIDLVEDLLTMAQGDAGRLTLVPRPCDLGRLVAERVELIGPVAAKQQVTVLAEVPEPVRASVDGRRIEQVVDNLLSNALKFTPPGGIVRVRSERSGGQALLSVRDSGLGIPREEQERVFERFSRASSAVRDQVPGSGLGLAVCRMIVERHGGRIDLESQEGLGTTVWVRLPLDPAAAGSPGRPGVVSP
jgi:signal transduction histidine kinase